MSVVKEDPNSDIEEDDVELSAKGLSSPDSKNSKDQKGLILWFLETIQLISLGVYNINGSTRYDSSFFRALGYIDGTSWGFLVGDYISFVLFGLLGLFLISFGIHAIVCVFHENIISAHNQLITVNHIIFDLIQSFLYIASLNIAISTFDCYALSDKQIVLRCGTAQCFKNSALQIIGASLAIVLCIIYLIIQILFGLCVFSNNYKHGGLFSSPSGGIEAFQRFLLFGMVFGQRMLINWQFWRGVVSVGTSLVLVIIYIYYQPFYNTSGNVAMSARYCIYGNVRLFMEIASAIQGTQEKPTADGGSEQMPVSLTMYLMFGFGLFSGIVFSVICGILIKWLGHKRWLLDKEKNLLGLAYNSGVQTGDEVEVAPQVLTVDDFKKVWMVERHLRFLKVKELRTAYYVLYAQFCYSTALRLNKDNSELLFHYSTFLQQIAKQARLAADQIIRCRMQRPPFALRVILASQMLDQQRTRHHKNQLRSGFARRTLTALEQKKLDVAEDYVEEALGYLRMFFEGLLRPEPDLWELQKHVESMSELTIKTQKLYIKLLETCINNPTVLRSYSVFTGQLLRDEGEAHYALERAVAIEKEFQNQNPISPSNSQDEVNMRDRTMSRPHTQVISDTQYNTNSQQTITIQPSRSQDIQGQTSSNIQGPISTASGTSQQTQKILKKKKKRNILKKKEKDYKMRTKSILFKQSQQFDQVDIDEYNVEGSENASMISNSNLVVGTQTGIRHVQGFITQFVVFLLMIIIGEIALNVSLKYYDNSLELLYTLCNLGYYTSRLSCTGIDLFLHEEKNWDPILFNEGDINIALTPVPTILNSMTQLADQIEKITERIYSTGGKLSETWERMDIDITILKWNTVNQQAGERTIRIMSLLGVETALVQQVRIITAEADANKALWPLSSSQQQTNSGDQNQQIRNRTQDQENIIYNNQNQNYSSSHHNVEPPLSSSSFYEALLFLLVNPLQPMFEGTKRALVDLNANCEYWSILVKYIYPIVMAFLVVVIAVGAVITETTLLKSTTKQRVKAFQQISELPSTDIRSELRKCIISIMNIGVAPDEFEREQEREEEYDRMREEVDYKGFGTAKEKEREKEREEVTGNYNGQNKIQIDEPILHAGASGDNQYEQNGKHVSHIGSNDNYLLQSEQNNQTHNSKNDDSNALLFKSLRKNANRLKNSQQKAKQKKTSVEQRRYSDTQWEQQLDSHIIRLVELYQSIPLQIQYVIYEILIINLIIMVGMVVIMIIVFLVQTPGFTQTHSNILMSGMYQSLLMMVKFVSGRLIAPSKKIEPPQNLEISQSTNTCFKNLDHMSSNSTRLMELLGCLGQYASIVGNRGYFDSKGVEEDEYDKITDEKERVKLSYDSFIDRIGTKRMNHKVLSNALLQRTDCLGQEFTQSQQSASKLQNKQKKRNADDLSGINSDFELQEMTEMCSLPISQRVFRKEQGSLFGFSGIESRLLHNIRLLSKLYLDTRAMQQMLKQSASPASTGQYSNIQPEQKFIQSVLHYDLAVGGFALGYKLMNDAYANIRNIQNIVLILSFSFLFAEVILCIVCAIAHLKVYRRISVQTLELNLLYESIVQSDEQEDEQLRRVEEQEYERKAEKKQEKTRQLELNSRGIKAVLPISFAKQTSTEVFNNLTIWTSANAQFQDVMITGVNWLDEGRQHLADTAQSVFESIQRGENMKTITKELELLVSGAKQCFNKEEISSENMINDILNKYRPVKNKGLKKKNSGNTDVPQSPQSKDEGKKIKSKFTSQEVQHVMIQLSIFQMGFLQHKREHTILYHRLRYLQDKIEKQMKEAENWVLIPFGDKKAAQNESKTILDVLRVVLRQVIASLFSEHYINKDRKLAKALTKLQKEFLSNNN